MNRHSFCKTICLIVSLIPLSTLALPTLIFDRYVDNGRTTIDTLTGLEWLDLPLTQRLSYYAVVDQLVSGGDFAGYRYATGSEVSTMFDGFALPSEEFFQLFGMTYVYEHELGYTHISRGFADPGASLTKEVPTIPSYEVETVYYAGWRVNEVTRGHDAYDPAQPYNYFGSFLVRKYGDSPASVPEIDAATTPLALGLLLLTALVRWERRRPVKL